MIRRTLEALVVEAAAAARPPERLTVSEAAEKFRYLNNPGSYVGPLKNDRTPYLVEPMNELQSHHHTGMVFAGPAQSAKTEMFLNWLAYGVKCDPADMMLVAPSNNFARDFSMRRIDRMHRHSPLVGQMLAAGGSSDNKFDKHYRSGMMLTLAWPAINELSGKPIPRLFCTDYDRMPEDVDHEGSVFDLAMKRATTFRSHGMCAAESSPGFIVDKPNWIPRTKHEAPPTKGILALYNRGDRRRWHWQCVNCNEWFEADFFEHIKYPISADFMESAEMATLRCPYCEIDYAHDPANGLPGKNDLNSAGRWVPDGMRINGNGDLVGNPYRSMIASFWLKGVAAGFTDWKTLVFKYLTAKAEFEATDSEEGLKAVVNTDLGLPYTPQSQKADRLPASIQERVVDIGKRMVPTDARFLVACIDIQKNRFVVQVHAVFANRDAAVIDRFNIQKSRRLDDDGERYWVNPGAYFEDWKLLMEEVLLKTYELGDGSGRRMAIRMTLSDSGGRAGVTANAYDFVRWLRTGKDPEDPTGPRKEDQGSYKWVPGMADRFRLVKGASTINAPRITTSYPDSPRKDRNAGARGQVPVLIINTNLLKDQVNNRLDKTKEGARFIFPDWLDPSVFQELTEEVRNPKGEWTNPKNRRNESWDLLTYLMAAMLTPEIALDYIDFREPPPWAAEWGKNVLVLTPQENGEVEFAPAPKARRSLADLAKELA